MTHVVLGVIGSDAHVVGITILEQALTAAGFEVTNLGVQTSQEEFVTAAEDVDADAILVSSLYGHAEQDCRGFKQRVEESTIDPLLYIGGNLSVGQEPFVETRETFRNFGFDRVFDSETDPEDAIAALREDLSMSEHQSDTCRKISSS